MRKGRVQSVPSRSPYAEAPGREVITAHLILCGTRMEPKDVAASPAFSRLRPHQPTPSLSKALRGTAGVAEAGPPPLQKSETAKRKSSSLEEIDVATLQLADSRSGARGRMTICLSAGVVPGASDH